MKKILSMIMVAVMAVTVSVAAMAAGSQSGSASVSTSESSSTEVATTTGALPSGQTVTELAANQVTEVKSLAAAQGGAAVVFAKNITGNPKVIFDLSGSAKAGDTVQVWHDGGNGWALEHTEVLTSSVFGYTFAHLSPVAIAVIPGNGAAAAGTSPKTGEFLFG